MENKNIESIDSVQTEYRVLNSINVKADSPIPGMPSFRIEVNPDNSYTDVEKLEDDVYKVNIKCDLEVFFEVRNAEDTHAISSIRVNATGYYRYMTDQDISADIPEFLDTECIERTYRYVQSVVEFVTSNTMTGSITIPDVYIRN